MIKLNRQCDLFNNNNLNFSEINLSPESGIKYSEETLNNLLLKFVKLKG